MEKVEFSKDKKGTVSIRVQNNRLYFEQILSGNAIVGEYTKTDIATKELVELIFYKTESIDAVIEQLERVKANLIMLSAC